MSSNHPSLGAINCIWTRGARRATSAQKTTVAEHWNMSRSVRIVVRIRDFHGAEGRSIILMPFGAFSRWKTGAKQKPTLFNDPRRSRNVCAQWRPRRGVCWPSATRPPPRQYIIKICDFHLNEKLKGVHSTAGRCFGPVVKGYLRPIHTHTHTVSVSPGSVSLHARSRLWYIIMFLGRQH